MNNTNHQLQHSPPPSLKIVPYHAPTGKKRKWGGADGEGSSRDSPAPKIRNACVACREKKTRCSGHRPCVRCQQLSQPCHYMVTAYTDRSESVAPTVAGNIDIPLHSPDAVTNVGTPDEPLQRDQYGYFHGGASEFAFLHRAKQKLASLPPMSINFTDYPLVNSGKLSPILPPKTVADGLIRTYFDFGMTTSRFVHEPTLAVSYEKLYGDDEIAGDEKALVLMVLAIGSHFSQSRSRFCGYAASVRFYDMADKLLQKEATNITFASLQARLLVTHYLLNHSRMHAAWSSFGIVVRHAQALGLHRRSPTNNSCIMQEYRKRTFWTIYVNDRILSSIFGRPCAIHDEDIDQEECAMANDEDITATNIRLTSNGAYCSVASLIHYSRLAQLLGRLLRQFYSPAVRSLSMTRLQEAATLLETQLNAWQDNLPPYLNYTTLPAAAMSIMIQRQICTLKMTFAHASLLLYRPFILHSVESAVGNSPSIFEQWIKRCHDKSIDAANEAVSECHSLQQRGFFSRVFWLVGYVQFAAIGTLFMYTQLWPNAINVRDIAERALEQFPVGVEGDLIGQRYLEILKELRDMTARDGARGDTGSVYSANDAAGTLAGLRVENEAPVFEDVLFNFGGSWSHNLFFDPGMLDDFIGEDRIVQ